MHNPALISLFIAVFLTACGGSGGGNGSPAADNAAPPATEKPHMLAGELQGTGAVSLGALKLPPNAVARPPAEVQQKLDEALARTNALRAERGLPALRQDESLAAYASRRAQELVIVNDHRRPDGSNPLDDRYFRGKDGIAENIAAGRSAAEDTVGQWRNSPNHYNTIVSNDFQNIGIGYRYQAGSQYRHYWTQIFSGGGTRSIYYFITPLDRAPLTATINAVAQYDGDGRLSVAAPADGSISQHGRAPHSLAFGREHKILIYPLQQAGWSYQTFGEITDESGVPEGYFNLGKAFVPAESATLRANYRGVAIGDLGQHSRVSADVSAHLDFSNNGKTLSVRLENAQRRPINAADNSAVRDLRLDFSDTLHWDAAAQQFQSDSGNARLYGADGAELGGQFERTVGKEDYRGAYGAKRVE